MRSSLRSLLIEFLAVRLVKESVVIANEIASENAEPSVNASASVWKKSERKSVKQ
jgi:hypothetical protein